MQIKSALWPFGLPRLAKAADVGATKSLHSTSISTAPTSEIAGASLLRAGSDS